MEPRPVQVMACLLIPAVIMASLYQPALMSHMQEEQQLMSLCITSSPQSTDTMSVCVRVCVCLSLSTPVGIQYSVCVRSEALPPV